LTTHASGRVVSPFQTTRIYYLYRHGYKAVVAVVANNILESEFSKAFKSSLDAVYAVIARLWGSGHVILEILGFGETNPTDVGKFKG